MLSMTLCKLRNKTMNYQPYLDFATDLAYRAGRITLGYFNAGVRPDYKADDTPVTAADRAAEQFIRGEIEKKYPRHAILGEEFGESLSSPDGRGAEGVGMRWIIDPIDGTKSFMRGVPLYGVLIGLEVEGVIQVGAAYYPGTDEMLCAAEGLGAWWNGRRARVSEVSTWDKAFVCYTNIRNMKKYGREEAWQRINALAYASRGWSDAYGYLAVATGRAEVMLDAVMAIWDCGPFPIIFKEAGGYFGSWDGKEGHTHNEALACNQALYSELMKLINA
jgi:myo-inositol-1(or 4)-monophosphatase